MDKAECLAFYTFDLYPGSLNAIETVSLKKTYGSVVAVDNLNFAVEEGEIFGFLGPNGAGKSTTMMLLTTLLKPTSGRATVAGYDVASQASQVRRSIGYVQQDTSVDEFMTGRENLSFAAQINRIPKQTASKRIDEVLDLVELGSRMNDTVSTYSGGMRKRLDIASGLLHMPRVLFLDEPTVGLDIQTRRKIWDHLRSIHEQYGITIFVSTHYMEEADKLCDRVAIIDYGKAQHVGTPQEMKDALGKQVISLDVGGRVSDVVSAMRGIRQIQEVRFRDRNITAYTEGGTAVIPQIFEISDTMGVSISSLSITQPTLDDVFLSHTGHELRDEAPVSKRFPAKRKMI